MMEEPLPDVPAADELPADVRRSEQRLQARDPADAGLEHLVGRLLTFGTYASVALLAVGVVALLAAGRSPLDGGPGFEPGSLVSDLVALRAEGFLWLGLVAVIATPSARVLLALVGYLQRRERDMALVAALILGVILLSVVVARGGPA
jgi:uncharacterized membrane protein